MFYVNRGTVDNTYVKNHASGCDRKADIESYVRAERKLSSVKVGTTYIERGTTCGSLGHVFYITDGGSGVNSFSARGSTIYLSNIGGGYNVYQITTTKYRYKFWRWGSWSGWGDWTTRRSADGTTVKEDSSIRYYVVGKTPN